MTLREAAQQALATMLEGYWGHSKKGYLSTIEALRQALAQPESEPMKTNLCDDHAWAGIGGCPQCEIAFPPDWASGGKITPANDREALIKRLRDADRDDDGNLGLMWEAADMLEADAQEIARSQGQEITKNDAKRDTLRTRLNIIMGQINQLEWKTGVGGSYFETVQEQCDAIVKDFGLKKLSSHLMSLPHTWVRRNTGLTDGYEIIEPRGRYVPANQPQTSGPAQQVTCKCTEYEFCESCYKKRKAQQVTVPPGYALVPIEPTPDMLAAYLVANTEYWQRTDELPKSNPSRWRSGTPSEATAESYKAMLKAAPQPPKGEVK